jgi:hypothetical protein
LPVEDILSGVEKAVRSLHERSAVEVCQKNFRIPKAFRKPKDNLQTAKRRALRTNADLKVRPPDMDKATLGLNTKTATSNIPCVQEIAQ